LLRSTRQEAGLRQEDLAKALGRKQAFVSKYEQGERRLDVLELAAICDAVGMTLTEFVRRFESNRSRPPRTKPSLPA
jgi:transcriptional regulator with XRE-family HTH domain